MEDEQPHKDEEYYLDIFIKATKWLDCEKDVCVEVAQLKQ